MTRCSRLLTLCSLALVCARVAPAGAADFPVGGGQLTLRDRAGVGSLALSLKDPAIPVPAAGSADDPSLAGVTVTLFSHAGGGQAVFTAPATGAGAWKVRTTPKAVSYGYSDRTASGTEILSLNVRSRAALRVRARAAGLDLAARQEAVGVRIEYGSTRVCAVFDGASVRKDQAGGFTARNASAVGLTDCDDSTIGAAICPCWTSDEIDALFPPGYFDANGRGGASCSHPAAEVILGSSDTCTIPLPGGTSTEVPRGGVATQTTGCLRFADPCDTPTFQPVSAAEGRSCGLQIQRSQIYQTECP